MKRQLNLGRNVRTKKKQQILTAKRSAVSIDLITFRLIGYVYV